MAAATLQGYTITDGRVQIPKSGIWFANVQLEGERDVSGAVDLKVADLVLKGTVLAGKPDKGRTSLRIVGGKGKWGDTIKAKDYSNDAGVRTRTVLEDAARDCGESFDSSTASIDARLGPKWTRPESPAANVLNLIAPHGWYVGEDGVTRIGSRTAGTLPTGMTRMKPVDVARATVTLASETIATLLPGVVVDGITAVDVEHVLSPAGLRTTIYGERRPGGGSRGLEAFAAMLDVVDPDRKFRGVFEYRVMTQSSKRLNLQPVRVSSGMPELARVPVRYGIPGAEANVTLGTIVLVSFVNSDPARPVVVAFEDPEGSSFLPLILTLDAATTVKLGLGLLPVARAGDLAGPFPVVSTQFRTIA